MEHPDPVSLRPLTPDNLDELIVAATDADSAEVMPPDWPSYRGFLESRRADPRLQTFVIVADERVVGAARLDPAPDGSAFEVGLWMARAYRAQGIGRQTLALLLDLARKHGATHVVASAAIDNRASRRLLVAAGADLTTGADGVEAAIPVSEPMIGIMSREGRMSAPHSASPHPGDQA